MGYKRVSKLEQLIRLEVRMVTGEVNEVKRSNHVHVSNEVVQSWDTISLGRGRQDTLQYGP